MRELNNLGPIDVGKGYQTGTRRKNGFFCVSGTPLDVIIGKGIRIEPERKYFCQFIEAKWASGHGETLE
jgi:hypothetical protein